MQNPLIMKMKNVVLLVRAFVLVSAWYDCRYVTVFVGRMRTVQLYDLYVVGSNSEVHTTCSCFYYSIGTR